LWSANPDNVENDLDELIALISLNDYPDESVNNDASDTESVGSYVSSKAGSNFGGRSRQRNNRQEHKSNKHAQNGYANRQQQQRNIGPPQRTFGPSQPPSGKQQQQFTPMQQQFSSKSTRNLSLQGQHSRKNFQFANLNLQTEAKPIRINELQFIYDLSTIDKQFQIIISDMTSKATELYYCTVDTKDKINGAFTRYVLPRPCEVGAGKKVWISIEFPRSEYRSSFGNDYTVSKTSSPGGLVLRPSSTTNGQIIWCIGYDEV